jgi:hypothetical protein
MTTDYEFINGCRRSIVRAHIWAAVKFWTIIVVFVLSLAGIGIGAISILGEVFK